MNENKLSNESIVAKLAYYYREPLYIDSIENPRVIEMMKYFNNHFTKSESAMRYAEKIKEKFEPTMTVPFPLVSDLVKISIMSDPPAYKEYVSPYETRDFKKIADESVSHDETLPVSDPGKVPLDEIWKYSNDPKIKFSQVVKTFGAERTYKAFQEFQK